MTNFTDIPAVVRALAEYFSVPHEQTGADLLENVTVNGRLSLVVLKDELQSQPELTWILQRFRANPFDMENVFDLEDGLRKALERHPVFTSEVMVGIGEDVSADVDGTTDAVVDTSELEQDDLLLGKGAGSLQTLMRYMRWANQVFYRACAELPADVLTTNRPMLFDNMLNLLNHVYNMQLVWQAHLQGREHGFTARRPAETLDFEALRVKQAELDVWYIRYADDLSVEQCAEQVSFEFIDGGASVMTRDEILHHVVNHASYHRGHIEGVFYQLGVEPPTTDLPVFLLH